jgi:hypothetical protein
LHLSHRHRLRRNPPGTPPAHCRRSRPQRAPLAAILAAAGAMRAPAATALPTPVAAAPTATAVPAAPTAAPAIAPAPSCGAPDTRPVPTRKDDGWVSAARRPSRAGGVRDQSRMAATRHEARGGSPRARRRNAGTLLRCGIVSNGMQHIVKLPSYQGKH